MRVGILQCGHFSDPMIAAHGDYDAAFFRLFAGRGYRWRVWPVVDMTFPDSAQDADAWLITGSRHGAYEALPFIPVLEALIRDIHAKSIPMIGICFGHQIIAQALGGSVEKFSGGWSVGRTLYQIGNEEMAVHAWHQDQVMVPPPGADIIGYSAECAHAALSYGPDLMTVQPHPELSPNMLRDLVEMRGRGVVPDPLLAEALETADHPLDTPRMADRLAAVLDRGRR